MNPLYAQVALRAGHRCEHCIAPEAVFNFPFEVEHIIPVSRGGADIEANWALACRSCNLRKSTHIDGKAGIIEKPNLQREGKKAKQYQVRQVRDVIVKHKLGDNI